MKRFLFLSSILLPVCLCSCSNHSIVYSNELIIPVPAMYYNKQVMDNKTYLYGLVDYGYLPELTGYNQILIPKDYDVLQTLVTSGIDNRLEVIKYLDYEEGSKLQRIASGSISGWKNLESVVFPSTIKSIGKDTFIDCPKLSILDFSQIEKDESFISPLIFDKSNPKWIYPNGIVYVKNEEIRLQAEIKFHDHKLFEKWKIVIK